MLNGKKLLTKILACCSVSGTEGNWRYRKYADGTFEAWCYDNNNIPLQTPWGSWYTGATAIQVTLPSFADMAGWSVTPAANGGEFVRIITKTGAQNPPYFTYLPATAVARNAASRTAYFYVTGTWS